MIAFVIRDQAGRPEKNAKKTNKPTKTITIKTEARTEKTDKTHNEEVKKGDTC